MTGTIGWKGPAGVGVYNYGSGRTCFVGANYGSTQDGYINTIFVAPGNPDNVTDQPGTVCIYRPRLGDPNTLDLVDTADITIPPGIITSGAIELTLSKHLYVKTGDNIAVYSATRGFTGMTAGPPTQGMNYNGAPPSNVRFELWEGRMPVAGADVYDSNPGRPFWMGGGP